MVEEAQALMKGPKDVTVLLDTTMLQNDRRLYFLDRLTEFDDIELDLLKVHDYRLCLQRNKRRNPEKWVPEEVVDRHDQELRRTERRSPAALQAGCRRLRRLKTRSFLRVFFANPQRIDLFALKRQLVNLFEIISDIRIGWHPQITAGRDGNRADFRPIGQTAPLELVVEETIEEFLQPLLDRRLVVDPLISLSRQIKILAGEKPKRRK
jgi:hypothetical protein